VERYECEMVALHRIRIVELHPNQLIADVSYTPKDFEMCLVQ
jgi:hypothetical protein